MVTMSLPPKSAIRTLTEIPISQRKQSWANHRRQPFKSQTVDTLLHILSICYTDSSQIIQYSDKGCTYTGSLTEKDVPLDYSDIIPNDSPFQEQMPMDETNVGLDTQEGSSNDKRAESSEFNHNISGRRNDLFNKVETNPSISFDIESQDNDNYDMMISSPYIPTNKVVEEGEMPMNETKVVLDILKGGLCNKHAESAERDYNMLGERNDLSHKCETNTSVSFDVKDQDYNIHDMMRSSPHLPTDKDVEVGEISGEFIDFMFDIDAKSVDETGSKRKDFIGTKPGLENENNLIPLSANRVENGGKDMAGKVNKITRNLVDYSEIGFDSSPQRSEHVLPVQCNSKINVAKKQDLVCRVKDNNSQNNKKRRRSCTKEERTNKKSKKSVDPRACSEILTSLGEHRVDASQEIGDAHVNKGAVNEKKRKRVLTEERKAKKKRKDRIKRAEKNRKLGVKRLKIKPVIKEKKISYCRHYLNGRCHEGEKCKFSHDTIPLTKSKPCCHFARHACMKGDDCPFDHQLSKYPCITHLSKGFCSRGSDCMFSHEAQPSESPLNASNVSKPEQQGPSISDSKKVQTKSCSIPKSISNTEQNLVETTPKLSARPPKGISFLSQEKPPRESNAFPKVNSEVKEITKTPPSIQDSKTPSLTQDSEVIAKASPIIPRGINFLSFGKKPGLDNSNGGIAFKISSGIEKPRLSNVEDEGLKSESTVNMVNRVKVDFSTDRPSSSQKPIAMPPFISNTSQKALQSTLAFASKLESCFKTKRLANYAQKL